MTGLITVLIVALCILMIFVVLAQNPKGGGLSSSFGAANQFGGIKQTMDVIEKITWGIAIAIVVLSLISSKMTSSTTTDAPVQTGKEKQG